MCVCVISYLVVYARVSTPGQAADTDVGVLAPDHGA